MKEHCSNAACDWYWELHRKFGGEGVINKFFLFKGLPISLASETVTSCWLFYSKWG